MKFKMLSDGLKLLKLDTSEISKNYLIFKIYHIKNAFIKIILKLLWYLDILGLIITLALFQYNGNDFPLLLIMIMILFLAISNIIFFDLRTTTTYVYYQSNIDLNISSEYDYKQPVNKLSDISFENVLDEYNKKNSLKIKCKHEEKQIIKSIKKSLNIKLKEL